MARSEGLDGAARIAAAIEDLGPRSFGGSLACFGAVHGGKVDNYHELVEVHSVARHLILLFEDGVSVHIWHPMGLKLGVPGLVITGASKVVLEVMTIGSEGEPTTTRTTEYRVTDSAEVEVRADWDARIPKFWRFGRKRRERVITGEELSRPIIAAPAFEIIDHEEYFTPADD
ncbi:MAG: hypothetical protein ACTHXA_08945 [Gulosibacter sp.]|uniref:hypothetical protein n=1 Tax=Gulosibacter sp. TaxID=2817531 RepID=UPI003F935610